jgi:uncharacterized protein YjbJ (UPF0337 family)
VTVFSRWLHSVIFLRGETQPLSEALQFGTIVGGNAAVAASAKQVKVIEQVVGKAAGDNKLESERKAERIEDKVHNAIGGFKDTAQREIDVAASSFVPAI